jgi:hypothetical protein
MESQKEMLLSIGPKLAIILFTLESFYAVILLNGD